MTATTAPGWRIGSLAGATISIDPSFALFVLLVAFINRPDAGELDRYGSQAWLLPIGYVIVLFASVLIHECSHALTGRGVGQPPQHIVVNLWGGYTQFRTPDTSPGRSVLVAVAGPVSNLVLAGLGWALLWVTTPDPGIGRSLLMSFIFANVLLGVFNLVPGLPLDGGRVLEAVVWGMSGRRSTGTVVAGWAGRLVAIAVVAWAVFDIASRGRSALSALWMVAIAALLWQAASQALRGAKVRSRAEAIDLRSLTDPVAVVGQGASLTQALGAVAAAADLDPQAVVVVGPTGPVGVLIPADVFAVPAEQHPLVRVEQVAQPHDPADTVDLALSGDALIGRLRRINSERLVVTEHGRIVGVIDGARLMSALIPRR